MSERAASNDKEVESHAALREDAVGRALTVTPSKNQNDPSSLENHSISSTLTEGSKKLPSLNANDVDIEKGGNNSKYHTGSNVAIPIPCSSKTPFVSRILPMSRKSSQVVPTSGCDDQAVVLCIENIPTTNFTAAEIKLNVRQLKSSTPEKDSEIHLTANNSPTLVTPCPKDEASIEVSEEVCRICHDNPSRMTLLSPCLCKGSMGKVHRACLERWLGESAKTSCEICGHEYETERRPRYTGWRSVVAWIRHPLNPTDTRNFFFDLACFFVLTPLAGISAWLCVVGAQHYSYGQTTLNPEENPERNFYHDNKGQNLAQLRNKNVEASNATWTSIGLLTLTGTLLAAYYVWLFVAVRYHIQVWRDWQARNYVVTISPLNTEAVRKVRELREAAARMEAEPAEPRPQQPQTTPEANITALAPSSNNNNTNNNNTNEVLGSTSKNEGKPKFTDESSAPQKYNTFVSLEEIEGSETVKIEVESNAAGPSYTLYNNNDDPGSFQVNVYPAPSEACCSNTHNKQPDKDNSVQN